MAIMAIWILRIPTIPLTILPEGVVLI
jgi:hypothetical protein